MQDIGAGCLRFEYLEAGLVTDEGAAVVEQRRNARRLVRGVRQPRRFAHCHGPPRALRRASQTAQRQARAGRHGQLDAFAERALAVEQRGERHAAQLRMRHHQQAPTGPQIGLERRPYKRMQRLHARLRAGEQRCQMSLHRRHAVAQGFDLQAGRAHRVEHGGPRCDVPHQADAV